MDKIKITNLGYFEIAVGALNEPVLKSFVMNASQQKQDATVKYVNWMVSYEFSALSALASEYSPRFCFVFLPGKLTFSPFPVARMDGIGSKVHGEELSLYIRRRDVLTVVKELDLKTLEANIYTMRKRLEKHFKSEYDLVKNPFHVRMSFHHRTIGFCF